MSDSVFSITAREQDEEKDTIEEAIIENPKELVKIYEKNKFMYKVLKDCLYDDVFSESLKMKLWDIIQSHKTALSLKLNSTTKTLQLFGLGPKKDTELTYDEKSTVIEQFLIKLHSYKEDSLSTELSNLIIENTNSKTGKEETRAKLTEQVSNFAENVLEFNLLLNEAKALHSEKIPNLCVDKYNETRVKCKLADCKSDCLNQRVKLDTIAECEVSKDAYRTLLDDISQQQAQLDVDLERQTKLKEEYDMAVQCKEYNELLKSYLHHMKIMDKYSK